MLFVQKLLDVTDVLLQAVGRDFVHELRQPGEKVAVVRDDDQGPVKGLQGAFEYLFGFDVQVVGRLVKDEEVVGVEQQFAQREPCFLSPGEDLDLFVDVFTGE